MQEKPSFPERYKKMVDKHLTPDPEWTEKMLNAILSRAFSRDPPEQEADAARRKPESE